MSNAISIRNLTKTFGPKLAVSNLDLDVPTGSLCGFIGPNGAGKTTTIRMIMSILFPDSGELSVLGRPSAIESKDRIGYLPEERGVYRKMKVLPFLTYMAKLKGVDSSAARQKSAEWLGKVGLGDVAKKKCEELSKGMQQKVQFISAVIHEPDLLILDEVFSGLDPLNRRLMRELIEEQHKAGRTIVFSTHAMYEAEQLCDRVFMIHRGVKVLDDTLQGIRNRFDPKTIVVEPDGHLMDLLSKVFKIDGVYDTWISAQGITIQTSSDEAGFVSSQLIRSTETLHARVDPVTDKLDQFLIRPIDWDGIWSAMSLPGIETARPTSEGFHLRLQSGTNPGAIFAGVVSAMPVRRIELKRVNLEDVFIDLVEATGDPNVSRDDLRVHTGQEAAHV